MEIMGCFLLKKNIKQLLSLKNTESLLGRFLKLYEVKQHNWGDCFLCCSRIFRKEMYWICSFKKVFLARIINIAIMVA